MFYDRYLYWCNKVGKTPSAVALEIGLKKSSVTRWKNGGGVTDATAKKVADYFGVTVTDFLDEQKEKPTTLTGDGMDDSTKRLIEIFLSASETEKAELLGHAEYLASKNQKG